MTRPDLTFDTPVTLAGGGRFNASDIAECLSVAPHLLAADGGADRLIELGHLPLAAIGDMDSLSDAGRGLLGDRVFEVAEQDSTDFEKCLTRIEAPLVLATGFLGGRLDHTLSVFNTLVRHPGRRCIAVGHEDVVVLAPSRIGLDPGVGERVSLFPLASVSGYSRGLNWPIDGIAFVPGGCIGTSNHATGQIDLGFDAPGMLLILPRRQLKPLIDALSVAPRW